MVAASLSTLVLLAGAAVSPVGGSDLAYAWEPIGTSEAEPASTTSSTSTSTSTSTTTTTEPPTTTTTEPPPPPTTVPPPPPTTQPPAPTTTAPAAPPSPAAYANATSIEQIVRLAAREFGIPEQRFVDVIWCESKFIPDTTNSSSGALGLGQHMPRYWADRSIAVYGKVVAWDDPVANARVSAWLWATDGSQHWQACGG